jgi:hypothetical protein
MVEVQEGALSLQLLSEPSQWQQLFERASAPQTSCFINEGNRFCYASWISVTFLCMPFLPDIVDEATARAAAEKKQR